jgi:hypothetical protein
MRSSSTRPPSTEGSGPASEAPQVPEVLVEASGLTRRQLLGGGVAAGLAVGAVGVLDAPAAGAAPPLRDGVADPTGIHPFRVSVPNKQLAGLRRRVAATRWPSMELVADRSQGVRLATAQALARFWRTRYDWRRFEAKLNAVPQFRTELGWETSRTARAWAELMRRLGYPRYVAQGGDVGAAVTDNLGRLAPAGLLGIHMHLLVTALGGAPMPTNTDEERAAAALAAFT